MHGHAALRTEGGNVLSIVNDKFPYGRGPHMRETREEVEARLTKRLTEEQHSALAAALGMDSSEINPTNALAARAGRAWTPNRRP